MRTEIDDMGEISIDNHAYYGIQSLRAANNFKVSGTQIHPEFIKTYLMIKKAAAHANNKLGELDSLKAHAIIEAINHILSGGFESHFIIDTYQAGAGTSQNMNVNEVITNVANEILANKLESYERIHPNDDVNRSQSTNDTYPTAMRLSCLTLSRKLILELEKTAEVFHRKANEFSHIHKSGRTHLQDALPVMLSDAFTGFYTTTKKLIHLIQFSQESLRELGIGGSAVGNGMNVPEGFKEEILPLLRSYFNDEKIHLSADMVAAMQSQLNMMVYSNSLRSFALEYTRILNDLRLLSSGPLTGLGEINLPPTQPGSSFMPGKVNPSILEMGHQVFFKVLGNDQAMAYAMQAGQLELNVMMPLMAHLSLDSTQLLINALKIIREKCLDGITANRDKCESNALLTTQVASALTPLLGHQRVAELVQEALLTKKSVIQLSKESHLVTNEQLQRLGLSHE